MIEYAFSSLSVFYSSSMIFISELKTKVSCFFLISFVNFRDKMLKTKLPRQRQPVLFYNARMQQYKTEFTSDIPQQNQSSSQQIYSS